MKSYFKLDATTKTIVLAKAKKLYQEIITGNAVDSICIDRRTFDVSDYCGAFGREDLNMYQIALANCYADADCDDESMYSWEEVKKQILSQLELYNNKPVWYSYEETFNKFMKAIDCKDYDKAFNIYGKYHRYWNNEYEANQLLEAYAASCDC